MPESMYATGEVHLEGQTRAQVPLVTKKVFVFKSPSG